MKISVAKNFAQIREELGDDPWGNANPDESTKGGLNQLAP
jgi:hypothetical protein